MLRPCLATEPAPSGFSSFPDPQRRTREMRVSPCRISGKPQAGESLRPSLESLPRDVHRSHEPHVPYVLSHAEATQWLREFPDAVRRDRPQPPLAERSPLELPSHSGP